ncbi:hypothetical protein SAMN04487775_10363 [Treponema bryantii]|uniref:Uncharacterized protein n=1 Tax=Treponema bryantii TaxID=163 RepID=A0A1I3JIW4_9SPIR|nr:hypothetical protein [Treponema bryantii]SFI60187.1 hypothetical protein SAMN04487775_10363 [Treponema bryantii]
MKLPELTKKLKLDKLSSLSKSQKILVAAVVIFLILDIAAGIVLIANKNKSAVHILGPRGEMTSLYALDSAASKGTVNNEYANFKFTKAQKEYFSKVYKDQGSVSLTVCFQMMPTKKQKELLASDANAVLRYGFLSGDDFTIDGKFIKKKYPDTRRIQVQADEKNAPTVFDISFAVQKNDNIEKYIPEGFYVYSTLRCRVLAAIVVPAEIGFDFRSEIPFAGFACNGGILDFKSKTFDFSGSSMVFPVQSNMMQSMPEYRVMLSENQENKTTREHAVRIQMNVGGEKLYLNNVTAANELIIPTAALNTPFSRVEFTDNAECVESLIMRGTKAAGAEVLEPVRTDPGLILNYKTSQWRTADYELYEWDRFPQILFFDTRNYEVQDKLFRRLAFFVEKQGYKGRLLTNEELGDMHGYNAHDYSAESMARFFNKATELNFPLNEEEELLKRILIHNKLLESDGMYVKANEGGLVSISRETPGWSRTNLLAHEGWHTIFFRDAEFRNFVSAVYYTFDPDSRDFLIDYFKSQPSLGYDVNDEYLMHNEFMAYIMQQRLSEVANYFVHLANRGTVINYTPNLAAYVRKTEGRGFEDAANALNDFVYDKYGIVCGNIALVSR